MNSVQHKSPDLYYGFCPWSCVLLNAVLSPWIIKIIAHVLEPVPGPSVLLSLLVSVPICLTVLCSWTLSFARSSVLCTWTLSFDLELCAVAFKSVLCPWTLYYARKSVCTRTLSSNLELCLIPLNSILCTWTLPSALELCPVTLSSVLCPWTLSLNSVLYSWTLSSAHNLYPLHLNSVLCTWSLSSALKLWTLSLTLSHYRELCPLRINSVHSLLHRNSISARTLSLHLNSLLCITE